MRRILIKLRATGRTADRIEGLSKASSGSGVSKTESGGGVDAHILAVERG